ncbi:MAG: alpha/beta hydrolase, partial [Acidimicrobiales bacterium]
MHLPGVVKVAGGLVALVGVGFTAERVLVGRLRRRTDPDVDPLLMPPSDTRPGEIGAHDGGKLHYLERGEGRPLVLLHGITLAARIWSPQLHQLAGSVDRPGFRVIAFDLRGHGDSSAGTDGYGLPVLARDLATVLTELDLRGAVVAGHSMGGMALMRFCADHPEVLQERVAALAFVATAASAPMPPFLLSRLEILGARLVDRLDDGRPVPSLRFSGNDASLVLCRLAFGKHPSAAAVEQVRACIEAMDPEASQRSGVGLLDHDVSETLPQVTQPAAIVVGRRDLLTPVAAARRIAQLLPHARFHVLPGAGHQLMQERPDELGAILR